MGIISGLIGTCVQIVIGWILFDRVPGWLKVTGIIATVIKVIGVLIIVRAILAWF